METIKAYLERGLVSMSSDLRVAIMTILIASAITLLLLRWDKFRDWYDGL